MDAQRRTDVLPTKGTTNIVMPAESNVTIHAEFASVGPGGGGGYYYGGSGDGTGTGDQDDEGLQDGLNMDVEYDIKGLVLGVYAEWGSNGGNKSFEVAGRESQRGPRSADQQSRTTWPPR